MPKKYTHIEIIEETLKKMPTKIKITYDDGSEEYEDEAYKCWEHLCNFAEQEGLINELGGADVISLRSDAAKVSNLSKGNETSVQEKKSGVETTETLTEADKKDNKKSGFNIKRITAAFFTLLVGGGIAYGAYHFGRKQGGNMQNNQFVQIVDKPSQDNITFEERLAQLNNNRNKVEKALSNMVNGKLQNSSELDECLSNIANASLANITEISNYVAGHTSTAVGDIVKVNFRAPYRENTIEFAAVNYFNNLRDNVINAAYADKDVDKTKGYVTDFNKKFIEFVFGNKPLPYKMDNSSLYYTFDSLRPSAKITILTMGMTMLNIENDFSIEIDGVKYDRMVSIEETYKLNPIIYAELAKTQQYSKTK